MNKYLEKIAKDKKENYTLEAIGGIAGASTLTDQYHNGHLTGRVSYYHGSTKEVANKIKKEGIIPRASKGVIDHLDERFIEKNKGLAFATKTKGQAFGYANQADAIHNNIPGIMEDKTRIRLGIKSIGDTLKDTIKKDDRITRLNIPTWRKGVKAHMVKNPELTHGFNAFMLNDLQKKELGENTLTHKGTIPTKYISGSKNYSKNSVREITRFIKSNPGRFAKGVGLTSLSATALGLAGHSIYDKLKQK